LRAFKEVQSGDDSPTHAKVNAYGRVPDQVAVFPGVSGEYIYTHP